LADFGGDPSPREQAITQLEATFRKTGAGFHSTAAPAHLAEVQQSLGPREAMLEYVIPYHRSHPAFDLYILFITHAAARTLHVALNEALPFNVPMIGRTITNEGTNEHSQIGQTVVETRTAIQTGDERAAKRSLRDLYKVLIQPVTDQKVRLEDFDRLIIVPHGPLHYVPFAALVDGQGKYLISKTAIAVAPSASLWLALTRRSRPVRHFVGFGSPDLTGRGMGELRYAAPEVTNIAKVLTAESPAVFLGREATEDRFVREAKSADILHLSTHGKFPDDDAMDLQELMLTKGTSGDGGLRAERVRRLSLPSTSLVVLSVCNGGLYRMGPADEPYGLVPAFLEAGSQNVLGTLWSLDDQFGEGFMEYFYQHVMQDGPAEAYRKACLHFLEGNENLRNWAAFVLVGPGRPFASRGN
jgi:CHAT domain-containing protein